MIEDALARWDLSDLFRDSDDPEIARDRQSALESAVGFEKVYRGRTASGEIEAASLN